MNKIKKLYLGAFILLFIVKGNAQVSKFDNIFKRQFKNTTVAENRALLKDIALCKCVMKFVKADVWRKDASLSLLYEFGSYQLEAYLYIDSVTNIFLEQMPGPEGTVAEQKGMLLHCVDYYNSPELWKVITEMDKYLTIEKKEKNSFPKKKK